MELELIGEPATEFRDLALGAPDLEGADGDQNAGPLATQRTLGTRA